jgi:WD40 repeat protein
LLWLPSDGDFVGHVALGEVNGRPVLATTSDDTAWLWDARSGEPLLRLEGHGGVVTGVALGEVDGQPVLATASDGAARIWATAPGVPPVVFRLAASAEAIALSRDRVAVACDRGVVVIEHHRDKG